MYSQDDTVRALTAFYEQIVQHLSLEPSVLKYPPAEGWDRHQFEALRVFKNEAVIELLRHIPYIEAERALIYYDTHAFDYRKEGVHWLEQDIQPLPSHCVYLMDGIGCNGYAPILDTERGTITLYSTLWHQVTASNDEMDSIPESEKWRGHRTMPAVEFLEVLTKMYQRLVVVLVPTSGSAESVGRIHSRGRGWQHGQELALGTTPLEELQLEAGDEEEFDGSDEQYRKKRNNHVVKVYNCFLRHGWPDSFNKAACKAEVIELEKEREFQQSKFMALCNPDAEGEFDDAKERMKIERRWMPNELRVRPKWSRSNNLWRIEAERFELDQARKERIVRIGGDEVKVAVHRPEEEHAAAERLADVQALLGRLRVEESEPPRRPH